MEDISRLLAQMRLQYIAELPSKLDETESIILKLSDTHTFSELFDELYRHIHSLKGSAGTHGLHMLSTIAHHLENSLNVTGKSHHQLDRATQDIWLEYLDLFRLGLEQAESGHENLALIEMRLETLRIRQDAKPFRCMLVDSSQSIIEINKQLLARFPFQIETCNNGYDALQRLLLEHFDLLITSTEVTMLNGQALIAALKLSETGRHHIPAILLTSRPDYVQKRNTDPDYVVQKDACFIQSLGDTIESVATKIIQTD